MPGNVERNAQAHGQGGKLLVERPEQCIRSQEDGSEQRHVNGAAARVMELLPLDKGKWLVGCSDDCLLQLLEIADGPLAWRRRCAACEFEHDKRMAEDLVRRKQRLKQWVWAARRLAACTRTNTFIASRNRSPLSIPGSARSNAR